MRKLFFLAIVLLFLTSMAAAEEGLVSVKSAHTVKTTADRLENALKAKGMTIFARIDHAAGAQGIGQTLRPTELLIFGNPKIGSALMQCNQMVGIDLPMKALLWQDSAGDVWLTYNDSAYLAQRYGLADCADVLKNVAAALSNFAKAATGP